MPPVCPRLTDDAIRKQAPPASGRIEIRDESTPGLTLRVYADGTRTWTVRVRLAGGRAAGFRRLTLGDWLPTGDGVGLSEARRRAREARARAQLGQDPQRPRKRRAAPGTLQALSAAFLADMRRSLRPNTLLVYEGRLSGDILPALGQRRPGQITRAHVRALLDDVARRSPSQAIRCRAVLSRLYAWAMARDLVDASPVAGVPKPARLSPGERVYSWSEVEAIWKAAPGCGTGGRLIQLALLTAARPMELLACRVDELDLEGGLWRLPAERSKSRRGRVIPLSPPAVELLREARGPYLFPGRSRGHQQNQTQAMLRRLRDASGIPDLTPRDCRRTVATHLAEAGTPDIVVSAILGHARTSVAVTGVYLRHGYLAESRAALEAWGARLAQLSGIPGGLG